MAVPVAVATGVTLVTAGGSAATAVAVWRPVAASALGFDATPRVISLGPAQKHVHGSEPASAGRLTLPHDLAPSALAIPRRVLSAYVTAARVERTFDSACHLRWQLLAGIGYIESDHARAATHPLRADGIARPPIYGPTLDGSSGAALPDTDRGLIDGDPTWDRAVGPMQFIPATWRAYGVDADGDHRANPDDVDDATVAAADYLCAAGGDLAVNANLLHAVHAYNHSWSYVRAVLSVAASYAGIDATALGIGQVPTAGETARGSVNDANSSTPGTWTPSPHPSATTGPVRPATPSATPSPTPQPTGASVGAPSSSPTADPDPSPTDTPSPTPSDPAMIAA